MTTYFELTPNGIEIVDDTFVIYAPYNELWKRDRTDSKVQAMEELKYIFLLCDYRSKGIQNGLKAKALVDYARLHTNLPTSWEEDNIVNECILLYLAENDGLKTKMYKSISRAFATSIKAINLLDDNLEDSIAKVSLGTDPEQIANHTKAINAAVKALLDYATEIPKKLEDIDKAMLQAKRENKRKQTGRSGIQIKSSMLAKTITIDD